MDEERFVHILGIKRNNVIVINITLTPAWPEGAKHIS
jgi:hypothetical protein